ncbi:hypothetical protein QBC33DRAFT_564510 [Phialemonium atrogriseum]|uniref:Uncharacterized protein n=1 Tax=Phialemonium atrogriseum TaxID=1093897 RepID=A0AAJ0BRC0_9PEZI|nr:uncharacterized protein QBC33DRAFT_564510 [Phialemonium atrogriseum]KAK1761704.1 hypothetical protein QBC33DRAFT_564510 [Phialemonium atrogriseum]
MGDRLRAEGVGLRILGYAWMDTSEKEYIYKSLSSSHYIKQACIPEPHRFATDADRDFLLAAYRTLKPGLGLQECSARLCGAGFTVWALTAGDA